ncbi:MAG: Penicillin-binding protein 1A [Firmicutes bacterium]|nr:Penicillin-binding protein 1A [candidate division NPL-UPA2 bacterium]
MAKKPSIKTKRSGKQMLLLALYWGVIMTFVALTAGLGVGYYLVRDVPPGLTLTTARPAESSTVLDVHGEVITQLHAVQHRMSVPLARIPQHLVEAVVVMEDIRFYDHFGFSPRDFLRALWLTATRQTRQGASTITQQVARNRILQDLRFSIRRKVQEIYVAFRIEQEYTKAEILEVYLNELFLGGAAHGFQAAAQQYFGKDVSELSLAESAMLVGIIPSPNAWRPREGNMETAVQRQRLVLGQMLRHGRITAEEHQAALNAPITLTKARQQTPEASLTMYFVDHVVEQVQAWLVANQGIDDRTAADYIHSGGLTIHTTLDLAMQRAAQQAALDIFTQPDGVLARLRRDARNDPNPEIRRLAQSSDFEWQRIDARGEHGGLQPQVSALFIEPSSGAIRVWLGGRDMVGRLGIDRVAGEQNQPGSAIKPLLVYGPALSFGGQTIASTVDDAPVVYPTGNLNDPLFAPRNFAANIFYGHTSFREGMARSYNVMAVRLFHALGIGRSLDWGEQLGLRFVRKAGDRNDLNLSTALGGLTDGLTLHEMVAAYNVFNNRGVYVEPHSLLRITSRTGSVLYEARPPERRIVLTEQLAWLMTDLMRGTVDVQGGVTGTGHFGLRGATMGRFAGEVSGKTGTTNDNLDALFVGFNAQITGGVWLGHDNSNSGTPQIDGKTREPRTTPPPQDSPPRTPPQKRGIHTTAGTVQDHFVRGGMPSGGANAVGSGTATAIFGRTLTYYYRAVGVTAFPTFPTEWYEEYGVFGPPRRLGLVRERFARVSGKYPSQLTPPEGIGYDWFVRGTQPRPENPCDMHVMVAICTESNALAGPYCPPTSVVMQVRVRREPYAEVFDATGIRVHPRDHSQQVPFEQCPVHLAPQGNGGNGSPPPPSGQ